jgi:hypothetical protein
MTRLTVHEYAAGLRPRYRAARKGVKKKILDEFCQTTGMHRKAAIRLLARPRPRLGVVSRGRPRRYGPEVIEALVKLWEMGDRMCGKLLAAVMPDLLAALERHGEVKVSAEVRTLLLQVSPSTIDRLLRRPRAAGAAEAPDGGDDDSPGADTDPHLERVIERQFLAINPADLQRGIEQALRHLWGRTERRERATAG